ncbi:MAG: 4Fe-4S binding protein [Candidatus Thorarchaeota archaeon]|nr:4Fe-4S binding protein [Candidatus Thorarchaeota archaeon]
MRELAVELMGIEFTNPVLTAAGPTSRDGSALLEAARGGAGGLVAKTVSVRPADVPRPNMTSMGAGRIESRRGILNAELWSELSVEQWLDNEYRVALSSGLPVIASIGYSPEEVADLGPKVQRAGVRAIEFSTHYVEDHVEIARALREAVEIPIFAKLSPKTDVVKVAKALEPHVDGFVAINTFGPCLRIDIETARPLLGSEGGLGWLSGPALRPIALRCVADVASAVRKPVIGVGGVTTGDDAIEFMMAGASLVQVCTAAILDGPSVYGRIAKEIYEWLLAHGKDSVEDVRGAALPHLRVAARKKPPAVVDMDKCVLCGLCPRSCVYDAITLNKAAKQLIIDTARCEGCGMCISVCPYHAIDMELT